MSEPSVDFSDDPALKTTGFTHFESGPVRPLALSSDGQRLYVANAPDNRLEIVDVSGNAPRLIGSVPVGLEPVAVALRDDAEAWVVNHLSDSVSIVDLQADTPYVKQTLWVGDEPRDIVFAGSETRRAFISAAHRGQNVPFDPQPTTEGLGRADVWVFDAVNPGTAAGAPLAIVNLFGDLPRPLAVSEDGATVYAGIFFSGNRTTVLSADILGGGLDKPGPQTSADGVAQPATGLIVQYDGEAWHDGGDPDNGAPPKDWSDRVHFELPDYDVFAIDAAAATPAVKQRYASVGTTLFDIAVRPGDGDLYVAQLEALNLVRFEGSGEISSTVNGHFVESRVAIVDPSDGQVRQRHLNKHIGSYEQPLGTEAERALSLAQPTSLAFDAAGSRIYVAAYGSQALGVFDADALAADSFVRNAADMIPLSAGGPAGIAIDSTRGRLYVGTRFDNGISVVDTGSAAELAHLQLPNPEPDGVVLGRAMLYDARFSSSRGDSACGGCHVFGDADQLAWDLGVPEGSVLASPNEYNPASNRFTRKPSFHPMKGPMTTQSLRGLARNGPMHWRGDRTGASRDADESIEEQAFEDFTVAFVSLLGRETEPTGAQMDAFAKFALSLSYPPNPIAHLDNSLTADQAAGREFYLTQTVDGGNTCNDCHLLDIVGGHFGTSGQQSTEGPGIAEDFKIPHLRNAYQKIGRFGKTINARGGVTEELGPQIRGFGFGHDGTAASVDEFLSAPLFLFPSDAVRRQVEAFVLAFPSELAPIVGQQVTLSSSSGSALEARARLLAARAAVTSPRPECDLVVKLSADGQTHGYVMNADGEFLPDALQARPQSLDALLSMAAEDGNAATFTCVPPGEGARIGVDRDADGILDGDEAA